MILISALAVASMTLQADTMPHAMHGAQDPQMPPMADHAMWSRTFSSGWTVSGMAQVFPIGTFGMARTATPFDDRGFYLTQAAAMVGVMSPGRRVVLRLTPNFEAWTLEDGELTPGGWGEGFIDSRHPHTVLHEAMLSINVWDTPVGDLSFSGGKGFAPYGTDDPMSRPSVKYPTNHHLSQILERFTFNAVWADRGWSIEAGVFGGTEPDGPYDLGNISSFGDSWSARVTRRFGATTMGQAAWEVSTSYARVAGHGGGDDEHADEGDHHEDLADGATGLFNAAVRLQRAVGSWGQLYGLVEYSRSEPDGATGYQSFLAEVSLSRGRHTPYLRHERATRPEYLREGTGGDAFFRYDHDGEAIGATRWNITSAGYGFSATTGVVSIRPFVEGQVFSVARHRGSRSAQEILGDRGFAALTVGARIFFGGDPMRMGAYGIFDAMTRMLR